MASFYLDHNVAAELGRRLQSRGHGTTTAQLQGMARGYDEQHLLLASKNGWILITHDHDFLLLQRAWQEWSADWGVAPQHAGILSIATNNTGANYGERNRPVSSHATRLGKPAL